MYLIDEIYCFFAFYTFNSTFSIGILSLNDLSYLSDWHESYLFTAFFSKFEYWGKFHQQQTSKQIHEKKSTNWILGSEIINININKNWSIDVTCNNSLRMNNCFKYSILILVKLWQIMPVLMNKLYGTITM